MRSGDHDEATTTELVADIAALAAELAARPAPDSGAACYEQVDVLGRAVDVLESAIAARVSTATRTGQVAEWGHTSPTAWLRSTLGMRHARAEERATLAAQLPRLPQTAKRLATGDLSAGYATAIAAGLRRLDDTDCHKAEDLLLGFVDEGHSVAQITRFTEKIKDLIADRDNTSTEPQDARRAEQQWLTIHRSGTGAFIKGHAGAELTTLLTTKLEPLARPRGPEDTRDHAQRLADALHTHLCEGDTRWDPILIIDLKQPARSRGTSNSTPLDTRPEPAAFTPAAHDAPDRPDPTAPSPTRPATNPTPARTPDQTPSAGAQTLTVTAQQALHPGDATTTRTTTSEPDPSPAIRPSTPDRPEQATADAAKAETPADRPRHLSPLAPTWPFDGTRFTARLTDGTPIPTTRARQILLNAGYSTLVLGTDGHPLYLGRRVRCATPAQRRTLQTRYPTCVVDDCDIPAIACQIDHIDGGWENGQPTDIDRLVICCAFHNRYKWRHPDRIIISQRADGRYRYTIIRPGSHQRDRRRERSTRGPSERGP